MAALGSTRRHVGGSVEGWGGDEGEGEGEGRERVREGERG